MTDDVSESSYEATELHFDVRRRDVIDIYTTHLSSARRLVKSYYL